MDSTLKTVNSVVSKTSPYRGLSLISSVQVVTFSQNTPIPDSDLSLKYAIIAERRATRDGFVLRSGDLDEDAFGLTPEEADLGFLTSLRDRYDSLRGREASLSHHDHLVLERLQRLFLSRSFNLWH